MKVVVAPDSFKGCLSAQEVAAAISRGVLRAAPDAEVVEVPLADGGEGTVDALVSATGGHYEERVVEGPLGEPVTARFGVLGNGCTAVVEMAAASGLPLVPETKRNPGLTSTYGTGELIRAALDLGARQLIVGVGGSATTDCGGGMAQALGFRFLDADGQAIERVTGSRLRQVASIDATGRDPRLDAVEIRVACDVDNPLYGPRGAAHVYAPQKGATPAQVEELDEGLRHMAEVIKRDLGVDVADLPGAGAAGGLGAGLVAFCGATLEPGAEIVLDAVGFEARLTNADLLITGEGKVDEQTAHGKTPAAAARGARAAGVPAVALGGSVALAAESLGGVGFTAVFSIVPGPLSLAEALERDAARRFLEATSEQVVRLFLAGRGCL
ncbi:MAG: glycerate kinase [Armatimonadota bacterium]